MPRFVILEHDHPHLHWDLMLQVGGALRTWRLAAPPQPGATIDALALGNHRLAYLDHEGPVSGNRGAVRRWDRGEYDTLEETADVLTVLMRGQRLSGQVLLTRREGEHWELRYKAVEQQA